MKRLTYYSMNLMVLFSLLASANEPNPRQEGYRGHWYMNQPSGDQYKYKYSGGLGSYTAKHRPLAWYSETADKTFFVYGGATVESPTQPLLIMASYFDHKTKMFPKPTVVISKDTEDAHHNPAICIDDAGYIWVFVSSHGNRGPDGFIFKSEKPYDVSAFIEVKRERFTYPQIVYFSGMDAPQKFLFFNTQYGSKENGLNGRNLFLKTSADGVTWSENKHLVGFGGHYQLVERHKNTIATAFNWHPPKGGLNARTNLYYQESHDLGQSWTAKTDFEKGGRFQTIISQQNAHLSLIRDYQKYGRLVYLKDLTFDTNGDPVILYVTSGDYRPGPESGPRYFTVADYTTGRWAFHTVCETDHNYDMGSIWIESGDQWKVIAPTEPGPQAWSTGGEVCVWTSIDRGETWWKRTQLTFHSERNHTYVRRPRNAHPDFYAFWADGDSLAPSISRLYFTNQNTDGVWMMPEVVEGDFAAPVRVFD